ncbi:MAG TPA: hypothetical protein VJG32_13805 [Anaerolineae bacterium]|nr:hypothetical protein [Anaerolineae bacterium]
MRTQTQSIKALVAKLTVGEKLDLYRTVVVVLGLVILTCIAGAILLAIADRPTPEFLVAIGSAAVGGLAGLLAPSPKDRS